MILTNCGNFCHRSPRRKESTMTVLAIIGTGNVGSNIARRALGTGFDIVLANSRGPASLGPMVDALGSDASADTVEGAARKADLVVVAIPIHRYADLPAEALAGKIVIDTGNYYPDWNGHVAELDDETTTTAELLQRHLAKSRVVKGFSNLAAPDIATDGTAEGSPNRRALAIAGDDVGAKEQVTALMNTMGFDVIDAGPLSEGWRFQRDTPAYGVRRNANEMRTALASAQRYRDMPQSD
ncbi:NADPH-dependent F420 reductase [Streptomyces sp. NPDC002755]